MRSVKKILIILNIFIVYPFLALAANCPEDISRTTVFYINGVTTEYEDAIFSKILLEKNSLVLFLSHLYKIHYFHLPVCRLTLRTIKPLVYF